MTRFQDGLAVYMPPRRERATEELLRERLRRERRLREDAETMRNVYAVMALWGGLVMILLTVILFYVV